MDDDTQVNFRVNFPKNVVTLPAWMGVCLAVTAILSAVALLTVLLLINNRAEQMAQTQDRMTKEVRVLQVHVQDVENAMIRLGLAHREDFAQWESGSPRHSKEK